jgi:hypothetical protein
MLMSLLLAAAPLVQLPEPDANFGFSSVTEVQQQAAEPAASTDPANPGVGASPAAAAPADQWSAYQATVTSYLQELPPPPPPPPGPPVAPPAEMGMSGADSAPGKACACDPYVDDLYCDAYCDDDDGCFSRCKQHWKQHCYLKKLHSTCDLYPHYAYFPKHHGYYYFRPYNAANVTVQQQTAVRMGGDPRNPYSTQVLANLFRDVPPPPRTTTHTRRQGPDLPILDELLAPKPAAN